MWAWAFATVGTMAAITCGIIWAGISPAWYFLALIPGCVEYRERKDGHDSDNSSN